MEGSSCSSEPALFLYCAQMDGVLQYHDNTHFLVCLPHLFLHSDYTVGVFFVCCFTTPHYLPRIFFLGGGIIVVKKYFSSGYKKIQACCKEYEKSSQKNKEGNERILVLF